MIVESGFPTNGQGESRSPSSKCQACEGQQSLLALFRRKWNVFHVPRLGRFDTPVAVTEALWPKLVGRVGGGDRRTIQPCNSMVYAVDASLTLHARKKSLKASLLVDLSPLDIVGWMDSAGCVKRPLCSMNSRVVVRTYFSGRVFHGRYFFAS